MRREIVRSTNAPASPLFSQAVAAGGLLFTSGMAGLVPATGQYAGPGIKEQTRQALANCMAVLAAGGATLDDVVEVGVLLADPTDFDEFNEEYTLWLPADPPARHVAQLGVDVEGLLVSIRMTAAPSQQR
jgi:enamine deaminase RidA (YjgF/YER057c/UK114 family)